MYRLQINLPHFSSCVSNFIKSFITNFETSFEYICCKIISADDIASGEAVRNKRLFSGYIYSMMIFKGVRKWGLGLKTPLELDILQKLYYLRKRD